MNKNITSGELLEESQSGPKDSENPSGTHLVEMENLELQSAETRENETQFNQHSMQTKSTIDVDRERLQEKEVKTHAKCSNNEPQLH